MGLCAQMGQNYQLDLDGPGRREVQVRLRRDRPRQRQKPCRRQRIRLTTGMALTCRAHRTSRPQHLSLGRGPMRMETRLPSDAVSDVVWCPIPQGT